MMKVFIYLFDKWWRPIAFWFIALILFFASAVSENNTLINVSVLVFAVAVFGLMASAVFQLLKKRWLKGILTGLLFGCTMIGFVLFGLLILFIETVDGDKWADNLTIPANIQLDEPLDLPMRHIVTRTGMGFQLYKSFQPGLYEYDFWTGKLESGKIYLKPFEITQEYALSADRLVESSLVTVYNPTDSIMKFGTTSQFTIYEGDWGKPYAARFEVWFKPDDGGSERKLTQWNYKIEGWMR